jgi:hypothetical protein
MGAVHDERTRQLLTIDAAADYVLGLPLLLFPRGTASRLGLPDEQGTFYQRVLGGVLAGTATASVIELIRKGDERSAGLGTTGAIAVNALGGGAVVLWLVASPDAAALPLRGRALLWGVATGVLAIGAVEAWPDGARRVRQGAHHAAT